MSKVAIEGNAAGTGTFTIAAPNSNTSRTLTLPDATGTVALSGVAAEVPAGTTSAPSVFPTSDTNTGIYFPAADTIGFVCGGTEDFRVDGAGQLWNTINSQVGTDYTTLYKGYMCRAWVNFNGTGTVAIIASGNVSSITDLGVGYYRVNFTTAMPDANYSMTCSTGYPDSTGVDVPIIGKRRDAAFATGNVTIQSVNGAFSAIDTNPVSVAIFR